jgi:hypothetical protein
MNFIRAVLGKFGLRLGRLEARNIVDLAYGMANNPMRRPVTSDEVRESQAAVIDGMAKWEDGWRRLGDSGKPKLANYVEVAKRYRDRVMFTYDYAKMVARDFPMVNRFLSIMQRKQTERSAVDEALQKLATPFERMPTARRRAINSFLLDTQFENAWAFDPVEAGITNPISARSWLISWRSSAQVSKRLSSQCL